MAVRLRLTPVADVAALHADADEEEHLGDGKADPAPAKFSTDRHDEVKK